MSASQATENAWALVTVFGILGTVSCLLYATYKAYESRRPKP